MKRQILIVDDDPKILELLKLYLEGEGYRIFLAHDGEEALALFANEQIDLLVLDVMMPKVDGMEVCRKIRESNNVPILMLSAKAEDMDKILGLMTGADDYLIKPFNPLELIVRVKALLRRSYEYLSEKLQTNPSQLCVGSLRLDKSTYQAFIEDDELALTYTEFEILYLLATNRGRVLSSEDIFERVWKEKYFHANNTVMVHMSNLRDKLRQATNGEKWIHTVWGVGYKFEC